MDISSGNDCSALLLKIAIELVSFPCKKMMIFHSYANVDQRVTKGNPKNSWFSPRLDPDLGFLGDLAGNEPVMDGLSTTSPLE